MASAYQPECGPPDDGDDEVIRCWCGELGTYDELFDDDAIEEGCGGSGRLTCYCGGDLCVCHHHGETECTGCDECGRDDGDPDFGGYQDEDDYGQHGDDS